MEQQNSQQKDVLSGRITLINGLSNTLNEKDISKLYVKEFPNIFDRSPIE